jgi:hypothetical protein
VAWCEKGIIQISILLLPSFIFSMNSYASFCFVLLLPIFFFFLYFPSVFAGFEVTQLLVSTFSVNLTVRLTKGFGIVGNEMNFQMILDNCKKKLDPLGWDVDGRVFSVR